MRQRSKQTQRASAVALATFWAALLPSEIARADEPRAQAATSSRAEPGAAATSAQTAPASPSTSAMADAQQSSSAPWVLVAAGGVALSVGIALGTWSVVEHRTARDLTGPGGGRSLDEQDQATYDEAIALRDDLRLGSGIAAATALGLFVTGGVLFAIDELDVKEPSKPGVARTTELVPLLAPGFAGGSATFRFW